MFKELALRHSISFSMFKELAVRLPFSFSMFKELAVCDIEGVEVLSYHWT